MCTSWTCQLPTPGLFGDMVNTAPAQNPVCSIPPTGDGQYGPERRAERPSEEQGWKTEVGNRRAIMWDSHFQGVKDDLQKRSDSITTNSS